MYRAEQENDSELLAICEIFQGLGVSGWALIKVVLREGHKLDISSYFQESRTDKHSWLSFVAGIQRGRSLRDKIAHQTEFPIEYMELNPHSEKESPIVKLGKDFDDYLPLEEFVEKLRMGVINGYLVIEKSCTQTISHMVSNPESREARNEERVRPGTPNR